MSARLASADPRMARGGREDLLLTPVEKENLVFLLGRLEEHPTVLRRWAEQTGLRDEGDALNVLRRLQSLLVEDLFE